jgi:hypothetical protein
MKQIGKQEESGYSLLNARPAAWFLGLAVLVLVALPASRAAQIDDNTDPGPMGAARLSSAEGQVRLTADGQVIAESAPANAPLFAGTRVETGDDGKAEIQFDDGSIARLSPNSALTIQTIASGGSPSTDLVLDNGLAYFELQGNNQNPPTRVMFGDAVATVSGFTVLRLRMDTPPGELAVFSGNAHLERGNAMAVDLSGGESITLNANDPSQYNLSQTIEPDSWDDWNSDRDQALSASASEQTEAPGNFVNSDNPNPEWSDLDANGNWYDVPGQGYVWSPFVAASFGWDPYGCGNWMWTPQFGYIWVSCESWGYLPFACGSWNYYNGFGWGWSPGYGACTPWWRRGGYGGWNIGRRPSWYRTVHPPVIRHPEGKGRNPVPVIPVLRHPEKGPNTLPQRGRNNPGQIAGHQVEPMQRTQVANSYVRSASGFVYHPANGYQGRREGGRVEGNQGNRNVQINRPSYTPNRVGNTYIREENPEPARIETQPGQGGRSEGNNQPPANVTTQPGRVITPPSPARSEPGRTYTPPSQPQPEPSRQYTPPPQPRPEPSRQYTPPPAQPRPEPSRQYTPPPQPRPEPSRQYTPPPQPRQEPSRPYSPPPSQRNPGGASPRGRSFAQPSAPPTGGGGGFHGGGAPAGGGMRGGGPVHR